MDKNIKHRFTAYCKECNFNYNRASDWIKHTNSQKQPAIKI